MVAVAPSARWQRIARHWRYGCVIRMLPLTRQEYQAAIVCTGLLLGFLVRNDHGRKP